MPVGDDLFADFGCVDAVDGNERDVDFAHQPFGHPAKATARHHRGDGRYPRLVPADARVNHRRADCFDVFCQLHHFFPGTPFRYQVEHAQPVNDDEVLTDCFADARHDFQRETHPVRVAAAVFVGTFVGAGADELIDEVALAAHDLDAVVARVLRQFGGADEVLHRAANATFAQRARLEFADGRFDGTRRDAERMVTVASGVENLHADFTTLLMHGIGDDLMLLGVTRFGHARGKGCDPTLARGRDAAGDDQSHPAPGTFAEESGHALVAVLGFFESGVHAAHQDAVFQLREAEIEGLKKVRIRWDVHTSGRIGVEWSAILANFRWNGRFSFGLPLREFPRVDRSCTLLECLPYAPPE